MPTLTEGQAESHPRPSSIPSTPESDSKPIFESPKIGKHKVRRLNFNDQDTPTSKQTLSINTVLEKELPRLCLSKDSQKLFSTAAATKAETGSEFLTLKSSPMQVFNSFSRAAGTCLAQTLCQNEGRDGLSQAKGSGGNKKVCCNCKKSRCLKLYCECFLNKQYCSGCKCANCLNTREHEEEREKAMQATLVRNPIAFVPKVSVASLAAVPAMVKDASEVQAPAVTHSRGCHCKKSGCLKKYCECYQIGAHCTSLCKCCGCHNVPGENCWEHSKGRKGKRLSQDIEQTESVGDNNTPAKGSQPFAVTRIGKIDRNRKVTFGGSKRKRKRCFKVALKELICGNSTGNIQGIRQSIIGIN